MPWNDLPYLKIDGTNYYSTSKKLMNWVKWHELETHCQLQIPKTFSFHGHRYKTYVAS